MPRPLAVSWLAAAFLALAAYNLAGAWSGWERRAFLESLPLAVPPLYLIASRTAWAAIFAGVSLGLWRLRTWGRLGALAALSLYLAQTWLDRLAFSRTDFARQSLPALACLSLAALAVVWGILLHPRWRRAFSA